jgi:xanthine dehydrogenase iron-sulfur cluster and FAD-binding subunit A
MVGAERVRILELPKETGRKKIDLSDFFVEFKKTRADFMELVKKAKNPTIFNQEVIKHVSDYNDELRKRLLE